MAHVLRSSDLPALAAGCALFGAGGGGATWPVELMVRRGAPWPVTLHDVADVDPATPCMAVAYSGSPELLGERLPSLDPFGIATDAVERWVGTEIPALCSMEIGGMNGLTTLGAAAGRTLVDADLMGRAFPGFDQVSLLVDGVPGVVLGCATGADGVAVVSQARPADVERLLRTAITTAGGWAGIVLGGFTVGDLARHAVLGAYERVLSVGRGFADARFGEPHDVARAIGGTFLAEGRVQRAPQATPHAGVTSVDLRAVDGAVVRLVARTELLAVLRDGVVVAAAPTVVAAVDAVTREVVQISELTPGRNVFVLALPAPAWWRAADHRLAAVAPSHFGVEGLDLATDPGTDPAGTSTDAREAT
ncbi:DUF917 family protein [Isoptericola cucumis]|uniref:S-methyl thiohydantoin desulfurase domain-containing protein n=1 Tax=Isoptericola cucumis TaxID=1776856 RepID=UPI00320AEB8C